MRSCYTIFITIFVICTTSKISLVSGLFQTLFQNQNSSSLSKRELPNNPVPVGGNSVYSGEMMEFGNECETNGKPCNGAKFLECIDGKCMCQNPMSRAYDEDLRQCVSLSASQCGNNKPPCVKNSQCLFGSCQCLQGHSETTTKVCLLNHREKCRPKECNADQGLACIRGVCQCIDNSLVFNQFGNKCVNPQTEFDNFARTVGRGVVSRVISGTVSGATSLVFLPIRLLVPGIG